MLQDSELVTTWQQRQPGEKDTKAQMYQPLCWFTTETERTRNMHVHCFCRATQRDNEISETDQFGWFIFTGWPLWVIGVMCVIHVFKTLKIAVT